MWFAIRPRLARRPIGWLLALLALVALQAQAFQRIAVADPMAGMDPELCSALSLAGSDAAAGLAASGASDDAGPLAGAAGSHAHCPHDCVCQLAGLDLITPPVVAGLLPAGARQFERLRLAMTPPPSAAWPTGHPRGPPRI